MKKREERKTMTPEQWGKVNGWDQAAQVLRMTKARIDEQIGQLEGEKKKFLDEHCTHTRPDGSSAVWSGIYDPPGCSICGNRV